MNTRAIRSTLIRALGVALALASGSAGATSFRLTDLGPRAPFSRAHMNATGQVTGTLTTAGGEIHAFLWDCTTLHDLGTLGGASSIGRAINDSGQVTGGASTADGEGHAFLWNGTMQDLGTPEGAFSSTGRAINDSGQVTGDATAADGNRPLRSAATVCHSPVRRRHQRSRTDRGQWVRQSD